MNKEVIETQGFRCSIEKDGIIRTVMLPYTEITLSNIKETITFIKRYWIRMNKYPIYCDTRRMKHIKKEIHKYTSNNEVKDIAIAIAFQVNSNISRVISSIFLKLSRLPYPVRLFTSEEKAIEWLKRNSIVRNNI